MIDAKQSEIGVTPDFPSTTIDPFNISISRAK